MVTEIEDNLYIGDIRDAMNNASDFDHIVSLCAVSETKRKFEPDYYHPLRDGRNEQSAFDAAVDDALDAIEADGPTLIHCAVGVSRSATVIITALAARDDISWDEARATVFDAKPSIAPHPELMKLAKEYLGEDGSVYKNPF